MLLQDEQDLRRSRLTERRFKQCGLDERLTLADFDWHFSPNVPCQTCFELHTRTRNRHKRAYLSSEIFIR